MHRPNSSVGSCTSVTSDARDPTFGCLRGTCTGTQPVPVVHPSESIHCACHSDSGHSPAATGGPDALVLDDTVILNGTVTICRFGSCMRALVVGNACEILDQSFRSV